MLTPEVINQLSNLKTEESLVLGNYNINIRALNIGEILECSAKIKNLMDKRENGLNLPELLNDAIDLLNKTTIIKNKEGKDLKVHDLPLPFATAILGSWIDLNFTNRDLVVNPLDQALSKVLGKQVSFTRILENLSGFLLALGTSDEEKSLN